MTTEPKVTQDVIDDAKASGLVEFFDGRGIPHYSTITAEKIVKFAQLQRSRTQATEHGEAYYAVFRVNKYGEYSLTISDWAFANLNEFPINTEYKLFTRPPQSQSVREE